MAEFGGKEGYLGWNQSILGSQVKQGLIIKNNEFFEIAYDVASKQAEYLSKVHLPCPHEKPRLTQYLYRVSRGFETIS